MISNSLKYYLILKCVFSAASFLHPHILRTYHSCKIYNSKSKSSLISSLKVQIFISIFRLVILTIFLLHPLFPTKYKILIMFLSPVCSLHSNPHLRYIQWHMPPPSLYLISTFSHLGLPKYVCGVFSHSFMSDSLRPYGL